MVAPNAQYHPSECSILNWEIQLKIEFFYIQFVYRLKCVRMKQINNSKCITKEIHLAPIQHTIIQCKSWSQCLTTENWINILHCHRERKKNDEWRKCNSLVTFILPSLARRKSDDKRDVISIELLILPSLFRTFLVVFARW